MAGEEAAPTSYIQHHLHNLTFQMQDGSKFWVLHLDTLIMAVLMGLVMVLVFWSGTYKATSGIPGKWQAFVEVC